MPETSNSQEPLSNIQANISLCVGLNTKLQAFLSGGVSLEELKKSIVKLADIKKLGEMDLTAEEQEAVAEVEGLFGEVFAKIVKDARDDGDELIKEISLIASPSILQSALRQAILNKDALLVEKILDKGADPILPMKTRFGVEQCNALAVVLIDVKEGESSNVYKVILDHAGEKIGSTIIYEAHGAKRKHDEAVIVKVNGRAGKELEYSRAKNRTSELNSCGDASDDEYGASEEKMGNLLYSEKIKNGDPLSIFSDPLVRCDNREEFSRLLDRIESQSLRIGDELLVIAKNYTSLSIKNKRALALNIICRKLEKKDNPKGVVDFIEEIAAVKEARFFLFDRRKNKRPGSMVRRHWGEEAVSAFWTRLIKVAKNQVLQLILDQDIALPEDSDSRATVVKFLSGKRKSKGLFSQATTSLKILAFHESGNEKNKEKAKKMLVKAQKDVSDALAQYYYPGLVPLTMQSKQAALTSPSPCLD